LQVWPKCATSAAATTFTAKAGCSVTTVKELLRKLDLGASVAEFDEALENYFVETNTFRALVDVRVDIVAGDKGTGKTAIYRILQKRYSRLPQLSRVEVLAAFNPTGSPVFQRLGEQASYEEGIYVRLWKTYIFSLVGNWLLDVWDGSFTSTMPSLEQLLAEDDLRRKMRRRKTSLPDWYIKCRPGFAQSRRA
jgi:hypothetical protein